MSTPVLDVIEARLPFSMKPIPPNITTSRTVPALARALRTARAMSKLAAMSRAPQIK